ncbi:MAG: Stp1/IreP family PP2C-type Ser/Thr phosphatase [Actinomycetota bacterium]
MSNAALRWAARTDVGKARDRNEDSYYGGDHVFAVADGLGGHNAGDVASKLAIGPIASLDRRINDLPDDRVADALADAVLEANRAVYKRAQDDAKVRGMGTTLTAIAVSDGSAHLAHVGDSRCYLVREGAFSQLSSDHTLVARMVQEGKLTPEQAEVHPQRSILTRALGAEPEVDVDSLEITLVPGDRLLLCSDGLSSVIGEERIRELLADAPDLDQGCRRLIDEANAHGGPDNVTVILVEMTGTPTRTPSAPPRKGAKTPAARSERREKRRFPVRLAVWVAIVLVLGIGSWLGFRSWVNRSYFVGVEDGRVAIFRGLPTLSLNHVEKTTPYTIEQIPEQFRSDLEEGIRAKSVADAEAVLAGILRGATPTPSPSPSASGT